MRGQSLKSPITSKTNVTLCGESSKAQTSEEEEEVPIPLDDGGV